LASSAFGQLIGSKPQEDKQPQKFRGWEPQGTSYATQGDSNIPSCYYCKKVGHLLEKCYSFRSQNFESRKEKLCNICFGKGHFAKQCRRRDNCMVAECGQRHHSLLHPVHWAIVKVAMQVLASIPSSERAPAMVNLDSVILIWWFWFAAKFGGIGRWLEFRNRCISTPLLFYSSYRIYRFV
jgi:hypothetical protein